MQFLGCFLSDITLEIEKDEGSVRIVPRETGTIRDTEFFGKGFGLLTEQQIARSWQRLFKQEFTDETLAKAEALLEGLRAESPLRHRLRAELDELCRIKLQKQS
jgi:hypothetical protein